MNKKLLLLLLLFSSAATAACPDLAGDYLCDTGDNIIIMNNKVENHMQYTINGEDFLADGIRRSKKQGYYEFVEQNSCVNNYFVTLDEQISDEYSTHTSRMYSLSGERLILSFEHREVDMGEEEVYTQTSVCKRL